MVAEITSGLFKLIIRVAICQSGSYIEIFRKARPRPFQSAPESKLDFNESQLSFT